MRNIILALFMVVALAVPATAQQSLPSNFQQENRALTRFNKQVVITAGRGGQKLNLRGVAHALTANVPSVTTGATSSTLTLPANSLVQSGYKLHVRVFGRTAANANTKTVTFKFGSTSITLLNAAANAKDLYADIEIRRTGASAQQITVAGYANGALLDGLSTTSTQTETSSIAISVETAATTANNDFILTGFTVVGESG